MSEKADVVIVGGGAAGLTAGLYASRGNRNVVLLDRAMPGGQAATTDTVENYPGFPDVPSGLELMQKFVDHAVKFGTRIETAEAQRLTPGTPDHTVHTSGGDFIAPAVVIACGSSHRKLGIPGEEEYANRGVSYCAPCDGPLFRNRQVLVAGGGDAAIEGALFLANFAESVRVIHRRDELRATKILQSRAFEKENLSIVWDSVATEVIGEQAMTGARVKNVKTGDETVLEADGVFILIGSVPNTQWLKGRLEMDERGYLKIDDACRTNIDGVFAAGEAADAVFRQIVVAAGQGAMAAISAERYIQGLKA